MKKNIKISKLKTCSMSGKCNETPVSWIFLFVGLIATISIRLVNFVLDYNVLFAKVSWYIGIIGFMLYFIYKFKQYLDLQKEMRIYGIMNKLDCKRRLSEKESFMLRGILCELGSRNTAINYFVIFFTSAIALLLGIYQDFVR